MGVVQALGGVCARCRGRSLRSALTLVRHHGSRRYRARLEADVALGHHPSTSPICEMTIDDVTYRQAMPDDFVGIADLDRHAWRDSTHPDRVPDGEHVWRIWVVDAFVFVAHERGHVVGAIVAVPSRHGTLFVHKVMVEEPYRRPRHRDAPVRAPARARGRVRRRRLLPDRRPIEGCRGEALRAPRLHREALRLWLLPRGRGPLRDDAAGAPRRAGLTAAEHERFLRSAYFSVRLSMAGSSMRPAKALPPGP